MHPLADTYSKASCAARFVARAAFALCLGLAVSTPVAAENQGVIDTQFEAIPDVGSETKYGFRNGSIVVAPIPFSNPTIGAGLMLGAGYLFTTSEGSKPSVVGIGGFRSEDRKSVV